MSDTPSYDPTPQPPAPSGGLPPALANISGGTLLWVQVVGGVLTALGTLFPWAKAPSFELFGQTYGGASINGFKYTGWATLILLLGLAVAALAFIKVRNIQVQGLDKLPPLLPLILAGVLALISVIEFISLMSDVSGSGVSSGWGVWLVFFAALVTFAAALLPVLKNRKA